MAKKEKKVLDYIEKVFDKMIGYFPDAYCYSVVTRDEEYNPHNGELSCYIEPLNRYLKLKVYKSALRHSLSSHGKCILRQIIAHEIGHLFIIKLDLMLNEPFKDRDECSRLLEETATLISRLILKMEEGG